MYIYSILKGKELRLNEIPENCLHELQQGIDAGFITSRYIRGIGYYSLVSPTIVDPGEKDSRDYNYSILYGASEPKIEYQIKGADMAEWISQGSRNTCAAWTAVECKRILDLQKYPDYFVNPAHRIHTKMTADGATINDLPKNYFSAENLFQRALGTTKGSSPQLILNAARSYMVLEYDQPTTISGSYIYQENKENIKYYVPEEHKIDGYAACSSFKQIIDALNSDHPVYLCYALTTGYTQVVLGHTDELQPGDNIGYHASACVGYTTRNNELYLKIQQSYDNAYKYNYMSQSYFNKYNKHAWAIIDNEEVKLIKEVKESQAQMNDINHDPINQNTPINQKPTINTSSIDAPTIKKSKISIPKINIPKINIPKINIKKK